MFYGLIILVFFLLVLYGFPIGFAVGLVPTAIILAQDKAPIVITIQQMFSGIDAYTLLAIPLFILAGDLMAIGGISRRLLDFASLLTRRIKGGLAMANVIASTLFGGISGSPAADTAAIGAITAPAMIKSGYSRGYTTALQSAAGPIGALIPPSIPMIVYGVNSNTSITQLFLSGILPGLMFCTAWVVVSYFYAITKGKGKLDEDLWKDAGMAGKSSLRVFLEVTPAILFPVLIIGGIRLGIVTPTEGAVVAVVYALFAGVFIYKELNLKKIKDCFVNASATNGSIMLVLSNVFILSWLLTYENMPQWVGAMVEPFADQRVAVLLFINLVLIIAGTFLETNAAIIMLTPLLLPMAHAVGLTSLELGIILVVNLIIGLYTPPVGVCLFVSTGITGAPMNETIKPLLVFIVVGVALLLIITFNVGFFADIALRMAGVK